MRVANHGLVMILDDEKDVLDSLGNLLEDHGYETLRYSDPESLYAVVEPSIPACLLLDNHLNNQHSGIDVHKTLADKGWTQPIIFLTGSWNLEDVKQAIRRGADDFIAKPAEPFLLLAAVERALDRSLEILRKRTIEAELCARVAALTPRERQITTLVLDGKLNKQIADELSIALVTVKVHRHRAMAKLKVDNVPDLARVAHPAGLFI